MANHIIYIPCQVSHWFLNDRHVNWHWLFPLCMLHIAEWRLGHTVCRPPLITYQPKKDRHLLFYPNRVFHVWILTNIYNFILCHWWCDIWNPVHVINRKIQVGCGPLEYGQWSDIRTKPKLKYTLNTLCCFKHTWNSGLKQFLLYNGNQIMLKISASVFIDCHVRLLDELFLNVFMIQYVDTSAGKLLINNITCIIISYTWTQAEDVCVCHCYITITKHSVINNLGYL